MKRYIWILRIIALIMLIAAIFPLISIVFGETMRGSIEPNWANPTGIQIKEAAGGTECDLSFTSSEIVSVFLIRLDHAREYRSPSMKKEPLPDPVLESAEGSTVLRFPEDDDYEILVLPVDGSFDFTFDYEIKGIDRTGPGNYISLSFFLMCSIICLMIPITIQRLNRKKGHE